MGRAVINRGDYHMTHTEIAEELGISRVRVQQIEQTALRKLRHSGKLKAFLAIINDDREDYYGEKYTKVRQES